MKSCEYEMTPECVVPTAPPSPRHASLTQRYCCPWKNDVFVCSIACGFVVIVMVHSFRRHCLTSPVFLFFSIRVCSQFTQCDHCLVRTNLRQTATVLRLEYRYGIEYLDWGRSLSKITRTPSVYIYLYIVVNLALAWTKLVYLYHCICKL